MHDQQRLGFGFQESTLQTHEFEVKIKRELYSHIEAIRIDMIKTHIMHSSIERPGSSNLPYLQPHDLDHVGCKQGSMN